MAAVGNNKLSLMPIPEVSVRSLSEYLPTLDLNCLRVTTKQFKTIAQQVKQQRDQQYRATYPCVQEIDKRWATYSPEKLSLLGTYKFPAGTKGMQRRLMDTVLYKVVTLRNYEPHTQFSVSSYEEKKLLVRELKYALLARGERRLANADGTLNDRALLTWTWEGKVVRDHESVGDSFYINDTHRIVCLDESLYCYLRRLEEQPKQLQDSCGCCTVS